MGSLSFSVDRMFTVMEYVVSARLHGIDSEAAFLRSIGFTSVSNLPKIKSGAQSFRLEHYVRAVEAYGLDGNFFLKESHTKMFHRAKIKPMTLLDEYREFGVRLKVELKKPR